MKKEDYDKMTIGDIEAEIKFHHSNSVEEKKKFIFGLQYLKHTGRFRENPVYKKSSFANYLLGEYNMRINSFEESARAFSKYPEESEKYGVGMIAKIRRQCGVKKEKEVIEEIKKTDNQIKARIRRDKIDEIIKRNSKKIPPQKATYKELYMTEKYMHERTLERYRDVLQQLKEANAQIQKLKTTIISLRSNEFNSLEENDKVYACV